MAPYLVASGHAALVWAVATSNGSWFSIMYNVLFVISNILAEVALIGIGKLRNPLRAHKNIIFASYRISPMPPWVKKSTLNSHRRKDSENLYGSTSREHHNDDYPYHVPYHASTKIDGFTSSG